MTDSLRLDARLDLPAAAALLASLRDNTGQEVALDFSDVRHLGAICLQVLISAARSARAQGRSLRLLNVSDRVVEQMRVMGVTPEDVAGGCA